ncbi:MAG: DUF285 domain-containing protein [Lachnospiraceae bacterium]|nr:DUF285 domain-containing protein [Lachnospiraceae bacterium]
MGSMFYGCSSLTSLDLSGFDTSSVIYMSGMFHGCSNLTSLDLNSFNTSNVTTMAFMFYECKNMTSLKLSNFDTSNVTNMMYMFACDSLESLDLSNFDMTNVTDVSSMIEFLGNAEEIYAPLNLTVSVDLPISYVNGRWFLLRWYREDTNEEITELPQGLTESVRLYRESSSDTTGGDTTGGDDTTGDGEAGGEVTTDPDVSSTDVALSDTNQISVYVPDVISNGKNTEQRSTPVLTYTYKENGKTVSRKLVEDYHYTVADKDGCDYSTAGVQTYIINAVDGSGFTGSVEASYTIYEKASSEVKQAGKLKITLGTKSFDYTGYAVTPDDITVYDGSTKLTQGTDYDIVYKNNYNAGKASVIVMGLGAYNETTGVSYIGSKELSFTIKKVNIKNLTDISYTGSHTYTGSAVTLSDLVLKLGSLELTEGTDYTVAYKNNTKPGTATVTIKAAGSNLTGSIKKTFEIKDIKLSDIPDSALSQIPYSPKGAKLSTISFTLGGTAYTLKEGTDYKVKYYNKSAVVGETVNVLITGKNTDKGATREATLTVTAADFALSGVKSESDLVIYAAKWSKRDKQIAVTDHAGVKLKLNTDYTLEWDKNDTGTAAAGLTLTITPKNENYTGTKTVTYRVAEKLAAKNYEIKYTKYFNGKTPVTILASDITAKNGADALTADDYTITAYKNNTKAGKATVTLEGKGKYYGKITLKFTIKD